MFDSFLLFTRFPKNKLVPWHPLEVSNELLLGLGLFLFFGVLFGHFELKYFSIFEVFSFFKKDFLNLFLERGREGEREVDKHQSEVASCTSPILGTWPATQAYALTGNQTSDPSVCRLALNLLSHTSQGYLTYFHSFQLLFTLMFKLPHHWPVGTSSYCLPRLILYLSQT